MNYLFNLYRFLISLPDISLWDTSNVTYMSGMFNKCHSLISLPDISKLNICKVNKDMIFMCNKCYSLISFPNIFKLDTFNIWKNNIMFNECFICLNIPSKLK